MPTRLTFIVPFLLASSLAAAEPSAVERGRANLEQKAYVPAAWSRGAYDQVWKHWPGVKERPADYDRAFLEQYGLHAAPFENKGLPMGLKESSFFFRKGIAVDCMVCHGGSVLGKSYVGLGNSTLDIHALFEDLTAAELRKPSLPFQFCRVKGTSEAGAMAVYLMGYRNPDLSLHFPPRDYGLNDQLIEDTPAWWVLKKKQSMYYTGEANAYSVRSKMQFMMSPLTTAKDFHRAEADFADIQAYLMTIEAPKYPGKVDTALANQGEKLFQKSCARCHGTYGESASYPNKIVPLDEIGTDRSRFEGFLTSFGDYYNTTWFAQEKKGWFLDGYAARKTVGYQAPPLDGIWATAPYLHNGSVPTLEHLLDSKSRPKVFSRSFMTDEKAYDFERIGWKVTEVSPTTDPALSPRELRRVYDTTKPGRSNLGHTYGDDFSADERRAVIEYLKTL